MQKLTELDCVGGEMVGDGVLRPSASTQSDVLSAAHSGESALTLITRRSLSLPLTPRMESLCSNWTDHISTVSRILLQTQPSHWDETGNILRETGTDGPCRLTHETREPLERPRNPHARVHLDEHAPGGVDVDLQQPCFVEGRVEQCQEALRRRVSGSYPDR
jgi:hypothetical protein